MNVDLEELERLAAQATPGPWEVDERFPNAVRGGTNLLGFASILVPKADQNAAYIVAACNAAPDLIAENRTLRERVAKYSGELAVMFGVKHDLEKQLRRIASHLETVQMCDECPAHKDCPKTGGLGASECVEQIIKWAGK